MSRDVGGGGGEGVSVNDEMRKKQIKDGLYVPISLKMKWNNCYEFLSG